MISMYNNSEAMHLHGMPSVVDVARAMTALDYYSLRAAAARLCAEMCSYDPIGVQSTNAISMLVEIDRVSVPDMCELLVSPLGIWLDDLGEPAVPDTSTWGGVYSQFERLEDELLRLADLFDRSQFAEAAASMRAAADYAREVYL